MPSTIYILSSVQHPGLMGHSRGRKIFHSLRRLWGSAKECRHKDTVVQSTRISKKQPKLTLSAGTVKTQHKQSKERKKIPHINNTVTKFHFLLVQFQKMASKAKMSQRLLYITEMSPAWQKLKTISHIFIIFIGQTSVYNFIFPLAKETHKIHFRKKLQVLGWTQGSMKKYKSA